MTQSTNDEIDLQQLLISLTRFIQSNMRPLLISAFVGMGVLLGISFILPKVYVTKMILSSDILTLSYTDRITESLDNLIREGNTELISQRLGITKKMAEEIKKIEIESVKSTTASEKEEATTFIVTVDITDKSILDSLQVGIINSLRNNEFVKIRVAQRQSLYKEMIEKVQLEIVSLDSLKKRMFSGEAIYSTKGPEMLLVDPTSIYSKILDLKRQVIDFKHALELSNSIQLIEGFTAYQKPAKPSHLLASVLGFFGGLFIFLFTTALQWAIRKAKMNAA